MNLEAGGSDPCSSNLGQGVKFNTPRVFDITPTFPLGLHISIRQVVGKASVA